MNLKEKKLMTNVQKIEKVKLVLEIDLKELELITFHKEE